MKHLLKALTVAALALVVSVQGAHAGLDFGNAAAFSPTRAAADADSVDDYPAIATDGAGVWVAAWVSDDPANGVPSNDDVCVVFSRSTDNGQTWTLPVFALPGCDIGFASGVSVATDGAGNWVMAWSRYGDIPIAVSSDNGASWTLSTALTEGVVSQANSAPTVATDGAGNWVVAWVWGEVAVGGPDTDLLISRSTDLGLTWSAPAPVSADAGTETGDDSAPRAVFNSLGTLGVVWVRDTAPVFFARSLDAGATFTDQVALGSGGAEVAPDLAADNAGTWMTGWWSSVGGIVPYGAVFYSRSTDDGASWSGDEELHTYFADSPSGAIYTKIASLADGQWAALWVSPDSLKGARAAGDWRLTVSYSRDTGVSWSSPSSLTSRSHVKVDPFEGPPALAQGADGRIIALWHSEDSLDGTIGTDRDIITATMTPDCPAAARNDCRHSVEPDGSVLRINDRFGGKDSLNWRLRKVEATTDADLGNPETTDDMVVCLYEQIDGSAGLVSEWDVRAGGTCNGAPCWTRRMDQATLKDAKLTYGSVRFLEVKAGDAGRGSISMRLSGATLAPPRLPLATAAPVRIQLINLGTNVCWEGVHDQAKINDAAKFVSTSD